MERELLRKVIVEWQSIIPEISLIQRPMEFEEAGNYVFVGIRQCGKSYLLYQRIQQLLREGHRIEEIVYISFDDERIRTIKAEELDLILQAHQSLFSCRPILFLDEIQNVEGWEYFARRLANEKYRVYITGSNAKMLSREIATTLGGRYWVKNVYPYSLREYLAAAGIALQPHWQLGRQQAQVVKFFDTYFHFGGFPELTEVAAKRAWLTSIYNKIFFSDIVVRNGIRNEEALRMTILRLALSVKQPIAYNRIANLVKSTGVNTNTTSVIDFVRYLREACLVFSIENYATKFVEKATIKKHYFEDNGLLTLFLSDPETSLLENICAVHLHRLYEDKVYFYNRNIEVDFYLPEQSAAIQVCYDLKDVVTVERETQALEALAQFVGLEHLVIVTRDEEQTIALQSGKTIRVVPVWKWLMEEI
ncbi:MAG: ATP-binding protein [Odoribacter sp.]|nr:ATP-binding protein [Odoribacter sp.]